MENSSGILVAHQAPIQSTFCCIYPSNSVSGCLSWFQPTPKNLNIKNAVQCWLAVILTGSPKSHYELHVWRMLTMRSSWPLLPSWCSELSWTWPKLDQVISSSLMLNHILFASSVSRDLKGFSNQKCLPPSPSIFNRRPVRHRVGSFGDISLGAMLRRSCSNQCDSGYSRNHNKWLPITLPETSTCPPDNRPSQ